MADEGCETSLIRPDAGKCQAAVDPDADPVGRNGIGERLDQPGRIVEQARIVCDGGEKPVYNAARLGLVVESQSPFAAFKARSKHLAEEFGSGAALGRRQTRAVVMAGKQAPEPTVHDDRYGERSANAHVFQIFDVDRRDRTQYRHGEIERPAVLVELRQDRDRDGIDIGNDAEQVAQIKRARLHRNVGSRIVQPEE